MEKVTMGIGGIITVAIAVIVGVILLQSSAQNIGNVVNTISVVNETFDTPVNGTAGYITNCRAISSLVVVNATNAAEISSGNYSVTNNFIYNGALSTKIVPEASAGYRSPYDWNLTYTCQPLTYDDSSSNRTVASLIIIMMAVALIAVVVYAVKNYTDN